MAHSATFSITSSSVASSPTLPLTSFQIAMIDAICVNANRLNANVNEKSTREQLLRQISFAFPNESRQRKILEDAIELAEEGKIQSFETHNKTRICWLVPNSQGGTYLCFHESCCCRSFFELSKANCRVMCKHLLAVALATCFGYTRWQSVSDEQFIKIVCGEV